MLDSHTLWNIATRLSWLFSGAARHRGALRAAHLGDRALADRLFESAAACYRRELAVEALARLRVHQRMIHVRSLRNPDREAELGLEVERLLKNLRNVEWLEPPFERVEAHSLLASWLRPATREESTGTEAVALAA